MSHVHLKRQEAISSMIGLLVFICIIAFLIMGMFWFIEGINEQEKQYKEERNKKLEKIDNLPITKNNDYVNLYNTKGQEISVKISSIISIETCANRIVKIIVNVPTSSFNSENNYYYAVGTPVEILEIINK